MFVLQPRVKNIYMTKAWLSNLSHNYHKRWDQSNQFHSMHPPPSMSLSTQTPLQPSVSVFSLMRLHTLLPSMAVSFLLFSILFIPLKNY